MDPIVINPNRIDLDEAYLQMAEIWARRSKANRNQVGALIVKNRQIISDGYNGMPAGAEDDVCEVYDEHGQLLTKPEVLHAESNAFLKITENGGVGAAGATLYVTLSPCFECAKLIKQAKISRVVYRHSYRIADGIHLLRKYGVEVIHLPSQSETSSSQTYSTQGLFGSPAARVIRLFKGLFKITRLFKIPSVVKQKHKRIR